jgi:hypothetical protein
MLQPRRFRSLALVATVAALVSAAGCTRPPRGGASGTTTTTAMDHAGGGMSHGAGGAHSMPPRLDHPPTAEQRAAAQKLVDDTRKYNTGRFSTPEQAVAAGWVGLGDGVHFTYPEYRHDGRDLDPQRPESVVFLNRKLVAVMYQLEPGETMDDVPDIAGNLTMWHSHGNLCFKSNDLSSNDYFRGAGVTIGGRCLSGFQREVTPMLHVWLVDNPCGPFAGVDAGNMTGSCVTDM